MAAVAEFEIKLVDLESRTRDEDSYSTMNLQRAPNQIHFLTVNMALHQTYCDLLRLFLAGYREAASTEVLTHFDPTMVSARAKQAVHHAMVNITIAEDCVKHCSHLRLYDIDAAICVYHAAQIMAFVSATNKRQAGETALKVGCCLNFLKIFYTTSEFAKPMIRDLERLSSQLQPGPVRQPSDGDIPKDKHESLQTSDGNGAPKLSIHSLLRRANFPEVEADESSPQLGGPNEDLPAIGNEEMMDFDFSFDPWMGWQGSLDPFGYLQLSDSDLY